MTLHGFPQINLPKGFCPNKPDVTGFLGTAWILSSLFVWG